MFNLHRRGFRCDSVQMIFGIRLPLLAVGSTNVLHPSVELTASSGHTLYPDVYDKEMRFNPFKNGQSDDAVMVAGKDKT